MLLLTCSGRRGRRFKSCRFDNKNGCRKASVFCVEKIEYNACELCWTQLSICMACNTTSGDCRHLCDCFIGTYRRIKDKAAVLMANIYNFLRQITVCSSMENPAQKCYTWIDLICRLKMAPEYVKKTKKLTKKTIGSKAFTGINKKAVIKLPKAKKKAYKKILLKKGMKKSMTFKWFKWFGREVLAGGTRVTAVCHMGFCGFFY